MIQWLSGKKTYIVAICTIVYGIGTIIAGDTPGGAKIILAALGLGTLRAGVAKSGPNGA
jgi:hypothetical protein